MIDPRITRAVIQRADWFTEHPQVGSLEAWAPRKGTKAQGRHLVPIYRKQWRKLKAQIAFASSGREARDKIYPRREVLYG